MFVKSPMNFYVAVAVIKDSTVIYNVVPWPQWSHMRFEFGHSIPKSENATTTANS